MPQFMLIPKSLELRNVTVGDMIKALKEFPEYYRLEFNPADCGDVTEHADLELLEGSTSDGPGTVWLKLKDD